MKYFQASFAAVVTRFYIMIAVALIAGFAGIPWLGLLCVPIFLTAMMGIKFDLGSPQKKANNSRVMQARSTRGSVNEAA